MSVSPKSVDILIFDGVEVMDFAAPFEVCTVAGTLIRPGSIEVRAVAPTANVSCRNGLKVGASCYDRASIPNVLVLPGGPGVEPLIATDGATMEYVESVASKADCVLAICSGALILAKLGLLHGRRASTHHSDLCRLRVLEPTVQLEHGRRYVVDGSFITSDGISAGIDASLYLIWKLSGLPVARATADWLEYRSMDWLQLE
jgi:transcriptional regulator GlxA family with amidase domain